MVSNSYTQLVAFIYLTGAGTEWSSRASAQCHDNISGDERVTGLARSPVP